MDPILGQIILWPIPWVPIGWALCDGSLLAINQHQALYTLLGNYFGGDGQQTFALPDLRNRFPMGAQGMTGIAQKWPPIHRLSGVSEIHSESSVSCVVRSHSVNANRRSPIDSI